MKNFSNSDGRRLVERMIASIQSNAVLLSDLDGVIGDGDHGVNMNKGFTLCQTRLTGTDWNLTRGLTVLGEVLLEEIGGAMGPLYGTFFGELAQASDGRQNIDATTFSAMLNAGRSAVMSLGTARVGDKTMIDTLSPALDAFDAALARGESFPQSLEALLTAAERGKESTRDLVAKIGRAARLGERSRGVLDTGAVSCWLLLQAMAEAALSLLRFEKRVLYRFNMPYALGWTERNGQRCVVGATEDRGPIVISAPPYTAAEILVEGPGGCMSLVSDPKRPGELYAIMGCFLGYNFHGGALYRIGSDSSEAEKVAELPFAHRMEVVERPDGPEMIIANLAAVKDSPQDWSRSGTVYSLPLRTTARPDGVLSPLKPGIHKNHGFLKTTLRGRPTILISGAEGLFALDLETPGSPFSLVLPHEVSEMAVYDLDGDGEPELVTIEPFHGNVLAIYKAQKAGWTKVWETALDYGHCVLADTILGKPSILVSNRAGDKNLLLFQFSPLAAPEKTFAAPTRLVIEAGVGAANMLVVHEADGDVIIATNQTQGEMVSYRARTASE